MKKLVFVLFAVFMLTACEKNDDNLELTNEGISDVETNVNALRGGGNAIYDRITIDYKQFVFNQYRADYRNLHGPRVGMISWYPCPNNIHREVWILSSYGTAQQIRDRTVPIHNDAAIEDPNLEALNIRLSPMMLGDTCNSIY